MRIIKGTLKLGGRGERSEEQKLSDIISKYLPTIDVFITKEK